MGRPRGIPEELDAETSQRIARTFLAVRIVRGSLLLLFLVLAFVGAVVRTWPTGVAAAIALTALVQAGMLAASCRQYAGIRRHLQRSRRIEPAK